VGVRLATRPWTTGRRLDDLVGQLTRIGVGRSVISFLPAVGLAKLSRLGSAAIRYDRTPSMATSWNEVGSGRVGSWLGGCGIDGRLIPVEFRIAPSDILSDGLRLLRHEVDGDADADDQSYGENGLSNVDKG
jgi:hypothetical protein